MTFIPTVALFAAQLTTATSDTFEPISRERTFQASVAGTGAVTATVIIDVSNDLVGWLAAATVSLSGTTTATDGFTSVTAWRYVRARLTAVSGTGAAVTVTMGVEK